MSKKIVITALFTALISAAFFVNIPLPGGVPVTLQDFMALLSGALLGPLYGTVSVILFLLLGACGLPVFNGKAGIAVITKGPTGGFLLGYVAAAFLIGLLLHLLLPADKKRNDIYSWIITALIVILGTIVLFALGIINFMRVVPNKTTAQVLAITVIPFIPGNIIKMILITVLSQKLRHKIYTLSL